MLHRLARRAGSRRLTDICRRFGIRGRSRPSGISDKRVVVGGAHKATPTTSVIRQAQQRKLNPYRKFAREPGVAGGGAKPVVNEPGAISFRPRGRGDRTAN